MPSGRTAHGEASRQKLLEVATELFAERGYAGTPVAAICERANVAKTALYWHFGSKEGLLAAALNQATLTWIEEIQKSSYEVTDPSQRLDRFVAGLRRLVEEHTDQLCMCLAMVLETPRVSSEIVQANRKVFERTVGAITQGVEDALGRTVPGLELVAFTAIAHLDAITLRYRNDPEGTDLNLLFFHAKEMIALAAARVIQREQENSGATQGESS